MVADVEQLRQAGCEHQQRNMHHIKRKGDVAQKTETLTFELMIGAGCKEHDRRKYDDHGKDIEKRAQVRCE
ncbi:hypothetical protein ACFQY5_26850 [Paeniroseomonas aquatica]|uniref:hypothetical protein n=1 Tax=Paeniroseomonas aquatica TaxID=373043 RepID=UPI00360EF630